MKVDFPTELTGKSERLKWLVENKTRLIKHKKNEFKSTDAFQDSNLGLSKVYSSKAVDDTDDSITRTLVLNTYNWMDSHDDVHLDGVFTKSIQENNNILHLHDHEYKLTAQVGDVLKVYEQKIKLTDLGVDKAGSTTSLMMDTEIKKDYNPLIFSKYKQGKIQQHSVGMYYVKIELAINDPEEKVEFAAWEKYIGKVLNRDKAEEQGFFFAIPEAKLIEGSAVIRGSNELTPTLEPKGSFDSIKNEITKLSKEQLSEVLEICKKLEPSNHSKGEPSEDTQKDSNFYSLILNHKA
jgi:hypothetical protein